MSDDPKRTPASPFHPPGVGRYPAVDDRLTTKVEAAPSWAIKMQEGINREFANMNAHLDLQDSAVDNIQRRVSDLETAAAKIRTGPQRSYSGPIQALSEVTTRISSSDTTQNLDIEALKASIIEVKKAQETAAVERTETAAKVTAVHDAVVEASTWVTRAWNAPTTRVVRKLVTAAIILYAAARGIHVGN